MVELKKDSLISLEIADLAYGGAGVGRINGFVVFVDHALPGDRVLARITKKSKNHAQAVIAEIERPSDRRVKAPCSLFGFCGGCAWQDLPYEDQLRWKQKQVIDTLTHIGGLSMPEPLSIIPSPEIWNYRNKMEYSFGTDEKGEVILGFHVPGRYDRIFGVGKCWIHPEPFDALLHELTAYAREELLSAYNQRTHQGFLRHAVMRHSKWSGATILALITSEGDLPHPDPLFDRLKRACPSLKGMVWGVNRGVADVASAQETRWTRGDPALNEILNGLTFTISPFSFFQTNTLAAEKLYQVTVEMAALRPHDVVLDAYCGAGAIALHCAREARAVVGVEMSRDAVWDARANAKANDIGNSIFIAAPMADGIALARHAIAGDFTRVIIDPPRGGMDKKSLNRLLHLRAPVFIYVSCNPSTLARDLQAAGEAGYRVEAIQAVDMFPHTYHIETVAKLVMGLE